MREDTKTLTFAAVVCLTCSLLLSGTAARLKSRQDANEAFDVKRNIVKVPCSAPDFFSYYNCNSRLFNHRGRRRCRPHRTVCSTVTSGERMSEKGRDGIQRIC